MLCFTLNDHTGQTGFKICPFLKWAQYFIVATDVEGQMLGFTALRGDGYLHSMFVHKDYQRQGIATALLQKIEAYASEHGIKEMTSEVSITARPFFEHHGYKVEREQRVQANRMIMTNFMMRKII